MKGEQEAAPRGQTVRRGPEQPELRPKSAPSDPDLGWNSPLVLPPATEGWFFLTNSRTSSVAFAPV